MQTLIQQEIQKLATVLGRIQQDAALLTTAQQIALRCTQVLREGGKILLAGNGGSAADAQHLAAELVGRLCFDRPGLAAIALTTDTSVLTAVGNDYGYEDIFARQIEAIGRPGDVFIGISTSGKSPNILRALAKAHQQGMTTVGFTGADAPLMSEHCDLLLTIPAQETSKIQECHIMFGHIIFTLVERAMFGEATSSSQVRSSVVQDQEG